MSLKCLGEDDGHADQLLIAELVLSRVDIDVHQFVDTRLLMEFSARNFYLLHEESASGSSHSKNAIIGPLGQSRRVTTTEAFYSQLDEKLAPRDASPIL